MNAQPLPVINLRDDYVALKAEIDAAVATALDSGWYILGREVAAFEDEFAAYVGSKLPVASGNDPSSNPQPAGALWARNPQLTCVGLNSGTDALRLALWACEIGVGDEVITVSHTAVATVAAIRLAGATPVFVDVKADTYTLDPETLEAAITARTKAVIPVHLYGHPAEMSSILPIARRYGLRVIEDCAQAHGARYQGRPVGTMGDLGCFSFYPTKNLGAFGDGGAVVGTDPALIERVRSLREYGWTPQARYISQEEGMNSRLDELQAAILRVKLRHLDRWNQQRRHCAARYAAQLPAGLVRPVERPGCTHVYHLYVVRTPKRDAFRQQLQKAGIGTAIHYPAPVHQQPAYHHYAKTPLPQTEQLATEIVSLPMHPHLSEQDIARVCDAADAALRA